MAGQCWEVKWSFIVLSLNLLLVGSSAHAGYLLPLPHTVGLAR